MTGSYTFARPNARLSEALTAMRRYAKMGEDYPTNGNQDSLVRTEVARLSGVSGEDFATAGYVLDSREARRLMERYNSLVASPTASVLTPKRVRDVAVLSMGGNKIAAIKKLREFTAWGLKEAKDFVEAIPVEPLFRVGDRVIAPEGHGQGGYFTGIEGIGTVVTVDENRTYGHQYRVKWDNGASWTHWQEELSLVSGTAATATPSIGDFRVGMRVISAAPNRANGSGGWETRLQKATNGVVETVDRGDETVLVRWTVPGEGRPLTLWHKPAELGRAVELVGEKLASVYKELSTSAIGRARDIVARETGMNSAEVEKFITELPRFKVGDRVRAKVKAAKGNAIFADAVEGLGVIEKLGDSPARNYLPFVRWDATERGRRGLWHWFEELELAPFAVGDKVVCPSRKALGRSQSGFSADEVGEVISIGPDTHGNPYVRWGSTALWHWTGELQPAPVAKADERFPIGTRVICPSGKALGASIRSRVTPDAVGVVTELHSIVGDQLRVQWESTSLLGPLWHRMSELELAPVAATSESEFIAKARSGDLEGNLDDVGFVKDLLASAEVRDALFKPDSCGCCFSTDSRTEAIRHALSEMLEMRGLLDEEVRDALREYDALTNPMAAAKAEAEAKVAELERQLEEAREAVRRAA